MWPMAFRWAVAGLVMVWTANSTAITEAQDAAKDVKPPPAQKASAKLHGRLPPYYGHVVDQQQREQIYRIQTEYRDKIESLERQLKELKKERDEKIVSLLTEEQKKQLSEIKSKRAAKRKEIDASPKRPESL